MSKGMDSKRSEKKKPAHTLKEKRAAKQEKRRQGRIDPIPGKPGSVAPH